MNERNHFASNISTLTSGFINRDGGDSSAGEVLSCTIKITTKKERIARRTFL